MARKKKENKPMTQQVRIYEDDARTIRLILATRERGVTFADIISEAIGHTFKTDKTESIVRQIEDIAPDEPVQPKRRNTRNN